MNAPGDDAQAGRWEVGIPIGTPHPIPIRNCSYNALAWDRGLWTVEAWGDTVFHTVIRRTVKFSDSTVAGEPITTYAGTSAGAESYRQLAREVLARCPEE